MRTRSTVTISLAIVGIACSRSPLDPGSADLSGSVVTVDVPASRLGINSGQMHCITAPCFDYTVRVTGKIVQEVMGGGSREISVSEIPTGAMVLVWTTGFVTGAQVDARLVFVRQTSSVGPHNRVTP